MVNVFDLRFEYSKMWKSATTQKNGSTCKGSIAGA
jgi:hypothetical protein